jgi:hypothetical protein
MQVGEALQTAIERTRTMLFEPFVFERWLLFGVVAFLDVFLAGGGLTHSGANFSGHSGGGSQFPPNTDRVVEWLSQHAVQIILIAIPLFLIALAIHIALLYVGCRGQVMFVRAVSMNGGQLGDHWSAVKGPAYSLFLFRIVLLGVWLGFVLIIGAFLLIAIGVLSGTQSGGALLLILIPFGVIFLLAVFGLGLVQLMLRSFVVPIMWARDLPCMEAWRVFARIAAGNALPLIGFVALKVAYSIGFGIATMFVGCLTCCVGLLPVVHHTLFAPYYVFDRAFSLELLAMTGEDDGILFTSPAKDEEPPQLHG